MQYVILGLLLSFGPRSLYDLRKQFEAGIALFYSASTGSLKHALDALVARGAIESDPIVGDPRGKRVYRVTELGESEFVTWMRQPITGGDLETALLSRIFFFALIPVAEQRDVLDRFIERARVDLASLEHLRASIDQQQVPQEYAQHARHQTATLEYGIVQHQTALDWMLRERASLTE